MNPPETPIHYCYQCAAPLQLMDSDGFFREICTQCGYVYYHLYKVGVAAIILEDQKLLLLKRRQDPWKDHWNFPAGFLEYEETPAQAVIREVREESGFEVAILGFHTMIDYQDDPRGNGIILFYRCQRLGGEFAENEEASACQFFAMHEIPAEIASTAHQRMIAELMKDEFKYD